MPYPDPTQPPLTADQLTGDPEFFLPQEFEPSREPIVWKGIMPNPPGQLPLTGVSKYAGQFVRGASLGLLGDPEPPQNIPQMLTEGAGMVLPGAAISSVTNPAVGLAPLLRTFPIAIRRAIAEGAAGGITGAAHAGATGGNVAEETTLGAVTGAAAGLAWGLWANRARGASAPEHNQEAVASRALGEPPPGPPGMDPSGLRNPQPVPVYPRQTPPGGPRASARVVSNEPVPDFEPPRSPGALGREPLALPAPEVPTVTPEVVPVSPPEGPRPILALPEGVRGGQARGVNPVEQLYMQDMGATQLKLPMDVVPNGRMNRYATPSRFKGTFETPELAATESNVIAQAAAREGAQTIRVTTSIQPRSGPPIGGSIRVYEGQPDGTARLISEKTLTMGAVKAAQVNAAPMRRMIPDYFEVTYNPQMKSDVLIPVNKEVEKGLQIALGIDPHQVSFPLAPEQLSWINGVEGRGIRQKMDISAQIPKLDEVMRESEERVRRAFLEIEQAPPAKAAAIIRPTDEAVKARELLANLEVSDADLAEFLGTMKGRVNPKERFQRTLQWLQGKCGGG